MMVSGATTPLDPRMQETTFRHGTIDIAAHLHLPPGFDAARRYPAILLSTPGSSVKEQIGGIYAARMAREGFVALTFDPAHQGASGGEPRDLEDPALRVEDIRCAVDHLVTLPFVDAARIGMLGLCAGGGYAVNAVLTDRRLKAIATVVGTDMGRAFRGMQAHAETLAKLDAVADARSAEARGEGLRRDPWIPDTLAEAEAQGITDVDLLEAVRFYRESEYAHPRSTNRLLFRSFGPIMGFDAFGLVPELLSRPLLVIVGGRRGATRQYETGEALFAMARLEDKAFVVVPGAGHYEMYWWDEYVTAAVGHLAPFFASRLAA